MRSRLASYGILGAFAAIASGCARPAPELRLAPGREVMDRCPASMALVVSNQTGYPIRVIAKNPTDAVSATPGTLLRTVASGVVDTIGTSTSAHERVEFWSTQSTTGNGLQPPLTMSGLAAQCVEVRG